MYKCTAWPERERRASGDSLTGDEIAATRARATGIPSTYTPMPHDDLRAAVFNSTFDGRFLIRRQ